VHEEIKRGVWQHYKGKSYLVLGVATWSFREPNLVIGVASHTEIGALWKVGTVAWDEGTKLVAWCTSTPPPRPPTLRRLVVYTALYETFGPPMFVRPVEMWQEEVEVPVGETAYTAAKVLKVPRFKLVREY
jgi:hypothetical protein